MQAQRNGTPMLAASGYLVEVDIDQCLGCGECQAICPFEAIQVENLFASVDIVACMGCGVCVERCPQEALSLVRCEQKGFPLEIDELLAAV